MKSLLLPSPSMTHLIPQLRGTSSKEVFHGEVFSLFPYKNPAEHGKPLLVADLSYKLPCWTADAANSSFTHWSENYFTVFSLYNEIQFYPLMHYLPNSQEKITEPVTAMSPSSGRGELSGSMNQG